MKKNLKISVELPKPSSPMVKHQSLLHTFGGGCYMNKFFHNLPPLNKSRPRKNHKTNDDEIKRKLHKANQDWNGWKFQIHWNKL